MGYTHYWRKNNKRGLVVQQFHDFSSDVRRLLKSAPVQVVFESDKPKEDPIVNMAQVRFNGIGSQGHETFLLTPDYEDFAFCKTAQKPYDLLVTACLIAAKKHFGPDITISSDGGEEDWAPARDLCSKVLGYGDNAHFSDDDRLGLVL